MEGILTQVRYVNEFLQSFVGVEPVLILLVIVFVSIISKVLNLRNRIETKRTFESVVIALCLFVSAVVSWIVIDVETPREVVRNALVLGAVSTILYKIVKRTIKAGYQYGQKLLSSKTGSKFDDDDSLLG